MDPNFTFDPENPINLGIEYDFEPSDELRKFNRQQVQNLEELIEKIRRNIKATDDPVFKNQLNVTLRNAENNLKKNRIIYYIEYFNELREHLKRTVTEYGVRFVSSRVKEQQKKRCIRCI
jgi:hypothetical protein